MHKSYLDELSATKPWPRLRLGISRCLLGQKVRFDGGHKRDAWLMNELANYADFYPICPEVECGMPIPREALRLVGDPKEPEAARLMAVRTGEDWTDIMRAWAERRLDEMANEKLCGYVFKRASPSNGMERVKIYPMESDNVMTEQKSARRKQAIPQNKGVGIFARVVMEQFPLLPVEEEGRLHDLTLRERFIERIFIMHRWYDFIEHYPLHASPLYAQSETIGALVDFHTRHKLLLLSHSPSHYRAMGRIVNGASHYRYEDLLSDYYVLLMEGLEVHATPAKHANVMQHMMGYFKKQLSPSEKGELLEYIIMYRNKELPLIVPMTLFTHYVKKYEEDYLAMQYYLNPYPMQLHLRNHI